MIRAALAVVAATSPMQAALACRCREPTAARAVQLADAVVLGRVTSVREVNALRTVFSVEVSRAWKRPLTGQVTIETGTTCALPAETGRTYLIYLRRGLNGEFYTRRCMGDRVDPASDLLAQVDGTTR